MFYANKQEIQTSRIKIIIKNVLGLIWKVSLLFQKKKTPPNNFQRTVTCLIEKRYAGYKSSPPPEKTICSYRRCYLNVHDRSGIMQEMFGCSQITS